MPRSDPRDPLDPLEPIMDHHLAVEVIRSLHRMSEDLSSYSHDFGTLSTGHQTLTSRVDALSKMVRDNTLALNGGTSPGLLANHAILRRELDQLEVSLTDFRREVVRIDPNAKTRADWLRWTVGLTAAPMLGLLLWFAAGWQETAAVVERHKQQIEWTSTDVYKRLDEYRARIESMERRWYRQVYPQEEELGR